VEVDILGKIIG